MLGEASPGAAPAPTSPPVHASMEARAAGAAGKQVSLLELRRSGVAGACVLSVLVRCDFTSIHASSATVGWDREARLDMETTVGETLLPHTSKSEV
eukprot:COSAG06_NODE_6967_length_2693_cov_1.263685_1_plen_96_part_00